MKTETETTEAPVTVITEARDLARSLYEMLCDAFTTGECEYEDGSKEDDLLQQAISSAEDVLNALSSLS